MDFANTFIELAGRGQQTVDPYHVVDCSSEFAERPPESMKGSKILVRGGAYKKDVDDLRESPTLKSCKLLHSARAARLQDPYFPAAIRWRHDNTKT